MKLHKEEQPSTTGKWIWKIGTIQRHMSKQQKGMKKAHILFKLIQTVARVNSSLHSLVFYCNTPRCSCFLLLLSPVGLPFHFLDVRHVPLSIWIPPSTRVKQWQRECVETTNGAITKAFFLKIEDRIKLSLNTITNYTTIVTGHGNIKSYLYNYKIIDNPMCPCKRSSNRTTHYIWLPTPRERKGKTKSSGDKERKLASEL